MSIGTEQMEKIRDNLQARHRQLRQEIQDEIVRSGDEHYVDLAEQVADPGDASVADLLADLSTMQLDRQVNEIRAIEGALARMNEGTYGECMDCGGDISFERLMVYPTARRCIHCQSVFERTYAHEGRPTL